MRPILYGAPCSYEILRQQIIENKDAIANNLEKVMKNNENISLEIIGNKQSIASNFDKIQENYKNLSLKFTGNKNAIANNAEGKQKSYCTLYKVVQNYWYCERKSGCGICSIDATPPKSYMNFFFDKNNISEHFTSRKFHKY